MYRLLLIIAVLLTSALGQISFPGCAATCFAANVPASNCTVTDISCLCRSRTYLVDTLSCLAGACNDNDTVTAETNWASLCSTAGVTVPSLITSSGTNESSPGTPATTSIPTGATSTSAAAASTEDPRPKSTSGRDIGIGVGIGVGISLLLVGGVAWYFIRRSRRHKTSGMEVVQNGSLSNSESTPPHANDKAVKVEVVQKTYPEPRSI